MSLVAEVLIPESWRKILSFSAHFQDAGLCKRMPVFFFYCLPKTSEAYMEMIMDMKNRYLTLGSKKSMCFCQISISET